MTIAFTTRSAAAMMAAAAGLLLQPAAASAAPPPAPSAAITSIVATGSGTFPGETTRYCVWDVTVSVSKGGGPVIASVQASAAGQGWEPAGFSVPAKPGTYDSVSGTVIGPYVSSGTTFTVSLYRDSAGRKAVVSGPSDPVASSSPSSDCG